MREPYIDEHDTLTYGAFAALQIVTLVAGLDPAFDAALSECAGRIAEATLGMEAALKRAGELGREPYDPATDAEHPRRRAQQLLERAVHYAESRPEGAELVERLLGGRRLTTVKACPTVKLGAALDHAIEVLTEDGHEAPEVAALAEDLEPIRRDLAALVASAHRLRKAHRAMSPAVVRARAAWIQAYLAAKGIVEGVLRYQGRLELLAEVFDDGAELAA